MLYWSQFTTLSRIVTMYVYNFKYITFKYIQKYYRLGNVNIDTILKINFA